MIRTWTVSVVWSRVYIRVKRTIIVWQSSVNLGIGCAAFGRSRTISYDLYTALTRLSSLVQQTSCTVVNTVSYGLTRILTILYDRLYDHTRTRHPYQVFKKLKNLTRLTRIHSSDPSVTRIMLRLVRFYVRFTRVANRISRVSCIVAEVIFDYQ